MHSARRNRPFVKVTCGPIPAELLESELFDHRMLIHAASLSAFDDAAAELIGTRHRAPSATN